MYVFEHLLTFTFKISIVVIKYFNYQLSPEFSLFCYRSLDRYAASEACLLVYDPQSLSIISIYKVL